MTGKRRLKRRILKEAVQENLDSIEGRFRPRRRRRGTALARSVAFVALPALLLTAYLLASVSAARFAPAAEAGATGAAAPEVA
ncbi:MAG: hypothetical protein R3325_13450, partial [Thermoanaerobaculia bacterium]|nr:hypothetical protein [Thermoanaerobaculia bacterium]